jgi:hypothetical protein
MKPHGANAEETVWNDDPGNPQGSGTGGGFSELFSPMPAWQAGAPHGPGRMVPDVAANADPYTGYNVFVHGAQETIGGTSAVAPLYAGCSPPSAASWASSRRTSGSTRPASTTSPRATMAISAPASAPTRAPASAPRSRTS